MNRLLQMTLGMVTAIGGFVDIGNLVISGITGARFGMSLTWEIVLGTVGMTVFGEMAGRVSAVSGRAVFHAVRERLGVRAALLNMTSSAVLNLLTLSAELAGVSLVLQLVTGMNYLIWVPLVSLLCWLVVWRLPFSALENIFGLLGTAFGIAAMTVARSGGTYLSAKYRRVASRRGPIKAIVAIERDILIAIWHMASSGRAYRSPDQTSTPVSTPTGPRTGHSPSYAAWASTSRSRRRQPQWSSESSRRD